MKALNAPKCEEKTLVQVQYLPTSKQKNIISVQAYECYQFMNMHEKGNDKSVDLSSLVSAFRLRIAGVYTLQAFVIYTKSCVPILGDNLIEECVVHKTVQIYFELQRSNQYERQHIVATLRRYSDKMVF